MSDEADPLPEIIVQPDTKGADMPDKLPLVRCKVCNTLVRCDRMEAHTAKHSLAATRRLALTKVAPASTVVLMLWQGDGVRFKAESEPQDLGYDELYCNSNRIWHLTPEEERRHPLIENKRQFFGGESIEIFFSKHRCKAKVTEVVRAGVVTASNKTSLPFKAILRG